MRARKHPSHDDNLWPESVALKALGVLSTHHARDVDVHLRICEHCQDVYRRQRATADLLGYVRDDPNATTDVVTPERLKSRLFHAARAARKPEPVNDSRSSLALSQLEDRCNVRVGIDGGHERSGA
jgi:hypothetical protein